MSEVVLGNDARVWVFKVYTVYLDLWSLCSIVFEFDGGVASEGRPILHILYCGAFGLSRFYKYSNHFCLSNGLVACRFIFMYLLFTGVFKMEVKFVICLDWTTTSFFSSILLF